ncbi:MAG: glycosyltransferase [Sedimentisphaerales bacterium]|nr:glycosyltransferase [Sedimentisphaerales bacterium]
MKIRTLMLGWEFPPFISGGLGTACYGLTKAMDRLGMPVIFVLPRAAPARCAAGSGTLAVIGASAESCERGFRHIRFRAVPSTLTPYGRAGLAAGNGRHRTTTALLADGMSADADGNYGPDIGAEVQFYADRALKVAQAEEFDLIHAHDWMTFPAALALAAETGKPLVVQVHSTEFDRSGQNVNQYVYDIERYAMEAADKIIAVSRYTKNIIVHRYGIEPEKIAVVYNGIELHDRGHEPLPQPKAGKPDKVVLFLGRITRQKGPEYFLQAAKKVFEKMEDVKFVMAGDGDLLYRSIEMAAELGIGDRVFFTRFLRGAEVDKAYEMADLYVMPSVSEPFGIAPLEALEHNVPVLVSKQSGIAEAFRNALKVDFWDVNEMANKMVAVLRYAPLQKTLRTEGRMEAFKFRWEDSALRINQIYHDLLQRTGATGHTEV